MVPAINNLDRICRGEFEDANDPALFEVTLPLDPTKELTGVLLEPGRGILERREGVITRFHLLAMTGIRIAEGS